MEFRVLGPVEVSAAGARLALGPPQERALLAVLVADAGRPVPLGTLIDRVWGERAPAQAHRAVYAHISRLRRTFEAAAPGSAPLVRRSGGYVLEVDPDRADLHRFRRLITAARGPGAATEARTELLRQALDLWRGTPLADVCGEWAARVRAGLEQLRLDAVVSWADGQLLLGGAGEVIGRVRELAAEHPLIEPLTGALMRALVATGRHAEALDCYAAARARLVDELGTEPGPELRAVYEAVLRGEPASGAPAAPVPAPVAAPAPAPESAPVRPRQLPADVLAFTGRERELAALDALLAAGDGERAGPVLISAVSGTAGVGKTALALRWAHRVRERFPDGQLYVDLRGHAPGRPMPAADALARLLSSLGVPGSDIPLGVDERAAAYRSVLAGRRVLILLDNGATVGQIRPLLPGAGSCAVLVTSRESLPGLVARDGARRIQLDLLPPADGTALLRTLIGPRAAADPVAVADLVDRCAGLPLALRIAAELATARPATPLADLVAELADEHRRLDLLDAGGDPYTAVRTVFSWSYRQLDGDAGRMFRLLGLHPGTDLDPYAAAVLAGTDLPQARRLLDGLTRSHLLHVTATGRYGMHDLLRAYAAERAAAEDAEDDRQAALTRLFDHFLATAAVAMDVLYPAERGARPRVAHSPGPAPPLAGPDAALAWLGAERSTLVAVAGHTAAHGWPSHTTRLARTLFRYLDIGGHYPDALIIHGHALAAARLTDDRCATADALASLGGVHWRQGRYADAIDRYQRALAIHRACGDRTGQARDLGNLGTVYWRLGDYRQAAGLKEQALGLYRATGDQLGETRVLAALGLVYCRLGDLERAADHHTRAIAGYAALGDLIGEAFALDALGLVRREQGRYAEALRYHRQALDRYRRTGNRAGAAEALNNLGAVHRLRADHHQAATLHREALAHCRDTGDRAGQAEALNGIGAALRAAGQPEQARGNHADALTLAAEIGDRYEQAQAHDGLALAHQAAADPDGARRHWQLAYRLYRDLGVPEADAVGRRLGSVGTTSDAAPTASATLAPVAGAAP
jgi:DNA-binding SARP family transcriptional activator/tetratricopeptide (TPR) repeat protein